jgi:hypothetical protein
MNGNHVMDVYTETVTMDSSRNYAYTVGDTYIGENADVERLVVGHFGKKLASLLAAPVYYHADVVDDG